MARSAFFLAAMAALSSIDSALAFSPSSSFVGRVSTPSPSLRSRASPMPLHHATSMSASLPRREAAAAIAGLLLLPLAPPLPANADSTGKFTSKRIAKNRYVPRIKAGVVFLKSGDMAGLQGISEDMVTAMKLYGQANRRGEVPDKISQRLEEDTKVFEAAVKKGSMDDAKAAFKQYFSDLPKDGKDPFGDGQAPPPPTAVEK